MSGNSVVEIGVRSALQASTHTEDDTPPTLRSFTFNLTTGVIVLSFSETVRASTLDPTAIAIQRAPNVTSREDQYTISESGEWTMVDSTEITLTLTFQDLNGLKQFDRVATGPNNTYISFTDSLVADMNGNSIIPITNDRALPVDEFGVDSVQPDICRAPAGALQISLLISILGSSFSLSVRQSTQPLWSQLTSPSEIAASTAAS